MFKIFFAVLAAILAAIFILSYLVKTGLKAKKDEIKKKIDIED